ncbi:hypothetical protein BLA29_011131, partial [Euroglyphus maynei]
NNANNTAQTQVIVDLDHNFRPFNKTITTTTSDRINGSGVSDGINQQIPISQTMSRIHSARSSTTSYCGVQYGTGGTFHIYGDVPPLHRRSFLSGNPQASDSMDNVAQLIPRIVKENHKIKISVFKVKSTNINLVGS